MLRKATERNDGLSRNCVVSEYDYRIVDDFLDNLENYRFDPVRLESSPSEMIVDSCSQFA